MSIEIMLSARKKNKSSDNDSDRRLDKLLTTIKRFYYSFRHIFENVFSQLQFEELMFIHSLCNDNLIKNFIWPRLKIADILQLSENYLDSKHRLSTFNLEIRLRDINYFEFIFLFNDWIFKTCDFETRFQIFRKNSWRKFEDFFVLKNSQGRYPILITYTTSLNKTYTTSLNRIDQIDPSTVKNFKATKQFYFLDKLKNLHNFSIENGYYSEIQKRNLINITNNIDFNYNVFRLFIGVTTTPEYFIYVDKFFTLFKLFLDNIYRKARIELVEIITSEFFQFAFRNNGAFWYSLKNIYNIEFETFPAFSKEYCSEENNYNENRGERNMKARFYQSHAPEDLIHLMMPDN